MKTFPVYLLTTITLIALITACGPSQEEQQRQQREQARQDSLEQVRQQQLQQQRMDSIAKARKQAQADSLEAEKKKEEEEQRQISFDPNGPLAVQVEAWRSHDKAQAQVQKWKDRGFPNAYVVKHGNPETGNIWFRVRLGRVLDEAMAQRVGNQLHKKYGEKYWIAEVEGEGTDPAATD
ncbi:MAG: SPOR domain-containing protein [Balneolaceae bacterium]|nr:SPOR domain-containing protein [Balneolaceae bacterium]